MTVTPNKERPEASPQQPRSGETQMDEVDVRLKFEESVVETINDEDSHYTQLRLELERDALNLDAETWSLAVDQSYMKELSKDSVKRQDVIYELMQTEMHLVRTLKVLLYVYKYELKQSGLLDDTKLERLFPAVGALLSHHQHLLDGLKSRQQQSQEPDSPNNYQISQLGDILITQFSGSVGEGMKECYSVFCSCQSDATKLYKEQLQNRRFQSLIKKIGQLPLVRRLGVPECFLLVTQRITKYPVLVERLIKNTEADTDEHKSLVQGLSLIKDTIEQVNEQVRLRDIYSRLEPKSQGRISEDRVFKREDLIQGNRTLLHEGGVQWRTPGRQKEIHAVLLSDVLILLQEKDQKFVFATMDKLPPVISLKGLLVREVALEDKAMYLICSRTSNMYEIHTGSQDERNIWMSLIREAVFSFIDEEESYSEEMAQLQQYQKSLKEFEDQLQQSAEAKQQDSVSLYEAVTGQECPHRGLLLKGDDSDLHQGDTLLQEALSDVENLQSLLMVRVRKMESGKADYLEESNEDSTTTMNGDVGEGPHTDSDFQFEEMVHSEGRELSADVDDIVTPNYTLDPKQLPEKDTRLVFERIVLLSQRLNSLRVVLAKHSSQMELLQACQSKRKRSARQGTTLLEQENQRNTERQKQELANLHKMQAQHKEEQKKWEKERDRHRVQMEVQEAEVRQKEEQCQQREEKLTEERAKLDSHWESYQHDLERLLAAQKALQKDQDKYNQEKEKLERIKTRMSITNPPLNVDDPKSRLNFPSFRSTVSGVSGVSVRNVTATPFVSPQKQDPKDLAPMVPPRRESISPKPNKPYIPSNLRSTTNDTSPALKPGAALQQQIPTKLEGISKKKVKTKPSHKRTSSAANIDVREVVPIRVSGKEGGSLKAHRTSSPQRIHKTDLFTPPGPSQNVKPSQSFSSHRRDNGAVPPPASPPAPPPFPKDILDPKHPKEIFL